MNKHWKVRIVRADMPVDPASDVLALDISAPDPEIACRDYFTARSQYRKDLNMADLPKEFDVEVAIVVNCAGNTLPDRPIWFKTTIRCYRGY